MKRIRLTVNAALLLTWLSVVAVAQEPVRMAGGRISFVPPLGFMPMSKEDIEFKFGRNGPEHAPEVVYSNERQSVSVAVRWTPNRIAPGQLAEAKSYIETYTERTVKGLVWLQREFVTINGSSWVHLFSKTPAIDTDVYNHMYFTSLDGKMLIFNFNSTAAEYEKHKDGLLKSAATIRLKPALD